MPDIVLVEVTIELNCLVCFRLLAVLIVSLFCCTVQHCRKALSSLSYNLRLLAITVKAKRIAHVYLIGLIHKICVWPIACCDALCNTDLAETCDIAVLILLSTGSGSFYSDILHRDSCLGLIWACCG